MTTYLFMLTPETEEALVDRILSELEQRFPEHAFVAGGADIPEFENSILPIHRSASDEGGAEMIIDETDVQIVKEAFAAIIEAAKNWKPS